MDLLLRRHFMKKSFLSRRPLCVLLIFAVVFGVYGVFLLAKGDSQNIYAQIRPGYTFEKAEVRFGADKKQEKSDIISVESVEDHGNYVKATVKAVANGDENVCLVVDSRAEDGSKETLYEQNPVKVRLNNIIISNITDRFYTVLFVLVFLLAVYYAYCFGNAVKTRRFSYDTLFFLSVVLFFVMMLCLWASASAYSFREFHTISSQQIYSVNQDFTTFLTLGTLPLMIIFVISMTVSNIVLIKKEGFRPSNSLGIITGAAMFVGIAVILFLYWLKREKASEVLFDPSQQKYLVIVSVIYSVVTALYVLFVILLTSSIIYGIYASKYTPKYDKDYIIVLGCKIKDDGTLYPLIRGRVDRAIEFYETQLKKTGKAACFVPSGGQGSDEVMPEGEAMKNYLLGKGIPSENIMAETKSATTRENMRFSKELIDAQKENASIVFSTTSYHVFRSGAIAYSNGINIDGIGSKTKWYFWPNAFLREVAGIFVSHPKKQLLIVLLIALSVGLGSFLYSLV